MNEDDNYYDGKCEIHGSWKNPITDTCPLCLKASMEEDDLVAQNNLMEEKYCQICKKELPYTIQKGIDSQNGMEYEYPIYERLSIKEEFGDAEDWNIDSDIAHFCRNCYHKNIELIIKSKRPSLSEIKGDELTLISIKMKIEEIHLEPNVFEQLNMLSYFYVNIGEKIEELLINYRDEEKGYIENLIWSIEQDDIIIRYDYDKSYETEHIEKKIPLIIFNGLENEPFFEVIDMYFFAQKKQNTKLSDIENKYCKFRIEFEKTKTKIQELQESLDNKPKEMEKMENLKKFMEESNLEEKMKHYEEEREEAKKQEDFCTFYKRHII